MAVGREFAGYTLIRKLARGGMADIFLATRRASDRDELCVIKMMVPATLRNPRALKLFLGEARLASQLDHPNIVHILALDRVDNYYFIAMEYIPGETLFHLLHQAAVARRPIRPLEAAALIRQTCQGLAHAHDMLDGRGKPLNLVHRDVSPSNIILGYDGRARLLDFGIAAADTRPVSTPKGKAVGKFGYMSPEQCRGDPLDRRSDLFSLGVVFWELVTGGGLFPGKDPKAIMTAIVTGQILPPSRVNANLPSSIESVIMRALSLDRRDRFQDARSMSQAIEEACFGLEVPGETDLRTTMVELFGAERAEKSRGGDIGDLLELETLLFDDIDSEPSLPWSPKISPSRRRPVLSPVSYWILIISTLLLLAASVALFMVTRWEPSGSADGTGTEASKALAGSIEFDSTPRGASVLLDGREIGQTTPCRVQGLPLGRELQIGLRLKGHQSWHGRIRLEGCETRRIHAALVVGDDR